MSKENKTNETIWTREMSIKALANAYKVAERDSNPSAMTSAIKEINAMHGYNQPEMQEPKEKFEAQILDISNLSVVK